MNTRLFFLLLLMLTGCTTITVPSTPTTIPPATITLIPTAVAQLPTATPTRQPLPPTHTAVPTVTPTNTGTPTSTPTQTPSPTNTPTITPTPNPFVPMDENLPPPSTAVPTPVPELTKPDDVIVIALLGNDVGELRGGRTDSIILVAINKKEHSATMISLPRDLYVYIPGWTMNRINLAMPHGNVVDYPGAGFGMFADTILYNFGIPVDYYARIGYSGFKQAVDAIGGIEMVVTCPLTDWRLISPELDPNIEENWEQFTLETAVHDMDGDLALWYARSRKTSKYGDFDRALRQQQVMEAILRTGVDLDLLPRIPALWDAYKQTVETNMPLSVILELAAIAPDVRQKGVRHLGYPLDARVSWREPVTKASVQLPIWDNAQPTLQQLLQPADLNRAGGRGLTVEIITNNWPAYRMAAENLSWQGFIPVYTHSPDPDPATTTITYNGANFKGSYEWLIAWLFDQYPAQITLAPDNDNPYDYQVRLGYDFDSCISHLEAP